MNMFCVSLMLRLICWFADLNHQRRHTRLRPLTAEAESRLSFNVCVEEFSISTHKSEVQTIGKEQ